MPKFFDGIYDNIEIFYIILLSLTLIAFIIYIFISNKKNKAILIDKKNSLRKNKDTLRINFEKESVFLYDNNNRELLAKYSFSEFKSLIDFKYLDSFENWLNKIQENNQNVRSAIGVYLFDTKNSTRHYVKITLLNYHEKTNEAFASMEELNRAIHFSTKLLDNETFFASINKLSGLRKDSISGLVVVLKITNMEFLRKRYGNENANILLGEMFNRIALLNNKEETYATYYQNNTFCIFKNEIKDKRQARSYVIDLIKELNEEPVDILNKQVEPSIAAGYTMYGENTHDLENVINLAIKSLEKNTFKFGKNRFIFFDSALDNDVLNQNKDIERIREIINNNDFRISYEPILCVEQMSILGYVIHSRFNLFTDKDNFLTVYNACEKYGLKNEFLKMYYRHIFDECLKMKTKNYRMLLKVDSMHLDIIKSIWLENFNYSQINLSLLINYEDIIHPKKQMNFNLLINEFMEMKIKFALLADENMLTIISNVIYSIDMIVFDEFMISSIEGNDLKQISIDNIITNTQTNKIKYIAYGLNKAEQGEVLIKLGVDNLVGPYISKPLEDIYNQEFLKNRSVQALNKYSEM